MEVPFVRMRHSVSIATLLLATSAAHAQACPEENSNGPNKESVPRSLIGKVVYHDEIRQWFGLQLDTPACGQKEIQLLQGSGAFEVNESNARPLEVFRGCRVTVVGPLGVPGTGYYSADLYQNVDKIDPEPICIKKPAFTDYSKAKPDPSIRSYRVLIDINYKIPRGHIDIKVSSGNRVLTPWQPYAKYRLTGLFAFYAYCADGYTLNDMHGTPEAKPWTMDNQVLMDPESAAAKHIQWVRVQFRCHR